MKILLNMYDHHIPDRGVKILLPQNKIKFDGFYPDGAIDLGNMYLAFEYENSSRGLLSHVAKYQLYCHNHPEVKLVVVIIESKFHQTTHKQDFVLANFISTHSPNNLTVEFHKCDGTEHNIKKIVKRAIKKYSH